jgi:hypothetical protein
MPDGRDGSMPGDLLPAHGTAMICLTAGALAKIRNLEEESRY